MKFGYGLVLGYWIHHMRYAPQNPNIPINHDKRNSLQRQQATTKKKMEEGIQSKEKEIEGKGREGGVVV